MNIPESFIHYVWEKRLAGQHFVLDTGDCCHVLKPGKRGNRDGPDFEGTEIKIGNQHLAGNAEIHLKSSDWYRHHHHTDKGYDSTILHIVLQNDAFVCNQKGQVLPTLTLPAEEIEKLFMAYSRRNKESLFLLRCSDHLSLIRPDDLSALISRNAQQRLIRKASLILDLYRQNEYDWHETIWKALLPAYGQPYNSAPMEWLGNTLTWKQVSRLQNRFSAEALLLGQAGFLDDINSNQNEYAMALRQEYLHLKNKYSLRPVEAVVWKRSPLRPPSFPEIRLAQLAAVVGVVPDLLSLIIQANSTGDIYRLFRQPVSGFWNNHYRLETKRSGYSSGRIGNATVDSIMINTIAPFLCAFSDITGNKEYSGKGKKWMQLMPPEQNKIIDIFVRNAGIQINNAFESQGLLEIFDRFCSKNQCVNCPVLKELIRGSDHEES